MKPHPCVSIQLASLLLILATPAAPQPAAVATKEAPAPGEALVPRGPTDAVELGAFVDGYMAAYLHDAHVAGAVVAVVRGSDLLLAKGYGYSDVAAKQPVRPGRTLFRIGSVSKLFVWTSVMQLVEQGKLDLDADVNTYLDEVQVPAAYDQPVTLKHLLTHTPGFEDRVLGLFARDASAIRPLGDLLRAELPSRVHPPGDIASYSNHGTGLAMHVVERVAGVPWEEYINENIQKPLGLNETSFAQPLPEALAENLSKGYKFEDGEFHEQDFEYIPLGPAGAASTTAGDMARFLVCQLRLGRLGDNSILKEETARQMQSELHRHAPGLNPMAHGLMDMSSNGVRILGHGGDTLWFHTLFAFFPDHDLGVFASFNTAGGDWIRFLEAFVDHYFPLAGGAPEAAEDQGGVGRFVGSYRANRFSHTTLAKLGALFGTFRIEDAGKGRVSTSLPEKIFWVRTGPLTFREEDGDRLLVFRENQKGRVRYAFRSDLPILAFERTPLLERPALHLGVLIFCLAAFLWAVLSWPATAWSRRAHGVDLPSHKRLPLGARLFAWGAALLLLAFAIGMAVVVGGPESIVFGLPPAVPILLWLPIVAAALSLGGLVYTVLVWQKRRGGFFGRFFYTLVVLACFAFLGQLAIWNLLGFRF